MGENGGNIIKKNRGNSIMKDIIIVGTGKASLLHYNSYKKIKKTGKILFVDIKETSDYIVNEKIYSSIEDCVKKNSLVCKNVIIDICTPKSEFVEILNVCNKLGIRDVLVEKPLVLDFYELINFSELNIVMVENYLFSNLTRYIKQYLLDNNKCISLIYTNFSKNRMVDSAKRRGYRNIETINYDIEIPHQVYLTQYFLGVKNNIINLYTCAKDMILVENVLKNHGYGLIMSDFNNVKAIYESDLQTNTTQKKIIICTTDNYVIEGEYALYSPDLKLEKNAYVNIFYNGKIIKHITISEDDNFYYFIRTVYKYFNDGSNNLEIINIKEFSEIMRLYYYNLNMHEEYEESGV